MVGHNINCITPMQVLNYTHYKTLLEQNKMAIQTKQSQAELMELLDQCNYIDHEGDIPACPFKAKEEIEFLYNVAERLEFASDLEFHVRDGNLVGTFTSYDETNIPILQRLTTFATVVGSVRSTEFGDMDNNMTVIVAVNKL